jgi:hypothetical protein
MPPGERLANPLTERLVAVVRSIGIEVRATTLSHKTRVTPFPDMLRRLR